MRFLRRFFGNGENPEHNEWVQFSKTTLRKNRKMIEREYERLLKEKKCKIEKVVDDSTYHILRPIVSRLASEYDRKFWSPDYSINLGEVRRTYTELLSKALMVYLHDNNCDFPEVIELKDEILSIKKERDKWL